MRFSFGLEEKRWQTFYTGYMSRFFCHLHTQRGISLIEVMVVATIFLIAAAIAAPQFQGSKTTAENQDAKNYIVQAYESTQEYFGGQENPNISGTYAGITAAKMEIITPTFEWTQGGSALAPSSSADANAIKIVNPASGSTGSIIAITLCAANITYVYCVVDTGAGPTFGASKTTQASAITNAGVAACNSTAGKAELYADNAACS